MTVTRRALLALSAAVLLGPALPSLATSGGAPVVEPLLRTASIALGTVTAPVDDRDRLVGVTWDAGRPYVQVRFRTPAGWTAWETPEDDSDVPVAEERAHARPGTEPVWRPADALQVQVRTAGRATGLQLVRVGDGAVRTALSLGLPAASADAAPTGLLGGLRSRADWGADESIRRGSPTYASRVEAVVVHHTAGGNDYAPGDVPARIRADYAYHVKSRGWSDLGYNLVVDKYGGIWEGRAGGLDRAVIGSHAQGFNTGTLGVSLLGDMTRATPTPEAVQAMSRVAAFAGAHWRFDPAGSVVLTSRGSPRYSSGTRVTLGRVHGHKDTGQTACPGSLYDRLGDVRAGAVRLLGPAPVWTRVDVTGVPVRAPQPMVVLGSLSRSAPWTAALRDEAGTVIARTAGEGTTARLEWNGLRPPPGTEEGSAPAVLPAGPGRYTWAVLVDDGYHAPDRREGVVDVGLPLVPPL